MASASAATLLSPFLFPSKSTPNPKLRISHFTPKLSQNTHQSTLSFLSPLCCSAVQQTSVKEPEKENLIEKEEKEEEGGDEIRRKLFVVNLPWDFTAPDIQKLFGECGTVEDVEIIKQKNGKSRGFAFITMASGEEAAAVKEKFNTYEVTGRVITIEFAKHFKKPSPSPASGVSVADGSHKIYVSNLAWKARSINLKQFFSDKFNPVSARVVFDSPTGKSAGYGFVGFSTKEEAEAAVSEFDGKELMGRPLRLKISEKKGNESGDEQESSEQPEET